LSQLKVDGGAVRNNFLMQFQSDILNVDVLRPKVVDTTAKGAAFLAGLATGFWRDKSDLTNAFSLDRKFAATMEPVKANGLYAGWARALQRSRDWEQH
jgi:glycerol kinase